MGKKKDKNKDGDQKEKMTLVEDKVYVLDYMNFGSTSFSGLYTVIYFKELNLIALFRGDQTKRTKIELPYHVIYINELLNVNFRIPQQLYNLIIDFKEEDKSIVIKFQDEKIKDNIGDSLKKAIKKNEKSSEEEISKYTRIEMKYKLAKILESLSFEKHSHKYDYRKFLNFDYLNNFTEINNTTSKVYMELVNRFLAQ